jgi:NAD(P)-dependent dehydrogenase (short-subunit alcohol dehydrogenase family)
MSVASLSQQQRSAEASPVPAAAREKRAILITGVSSGIGWATAKVFLEHGFQVFGSVRNQCDAERVSGQLGSAFTPLLFDICREEQVRAGAELVMNALGSRTLSGLINNAGITVAGPLPLLPVERYRQQIEVNLVGPFIVTQAFLPAMGFGKNNGSFPKARIINIGSIAGRLAAPFVGAYVVSKHGLEGFSDTLRRELQMFGIDVIQIDPGPVKTPIWAKGEGRLLIDFPDTCYTRSIERFHRAAMNEARKGFEPETVAEIIYQTFVNPKPKSYYLVMRNKLVKFLLPVYLPSHILDRILARVFAMKSPPARVDAAAKPSE